MIRNSVTFVTTMIFLLVLFGNSKQHLSAQMFSSPQVRVKSAQSDPAQRLKATLESQQWSAAARQMVQLRESTWGLLPVSELDSQTKLFRDGQRHLDEISNVWLQQYPELRLVWRSLVTEQAKSALENSTDERALKQFLERYCHSQFAGEARFRLARVYFDQGELDKARRTLIPMDRQFQRFLADSEADVGYLTDPEVDLAEVAATLIVIAKLQNTEVVGHLSWFNERFGKQQAQFGNLQGEWTQVLQQALADVNAVEGLGERTKDVGQVDVGDKQLWQIDFPEKQWLANPPKLFDRFVVWRDQANLFAADSQTGEALFATQDSVADFAIWQNVDQHPSRSCQPTVSYHKDQIFAVFHSQGVDQIVGVDLQDGARLLSGFPVRAPGRHWRFAGAPVVVDGMMLVMAYRVLPNSRQTETHIFAYALRTNRLPYPLSRVWSTKICESDNQFGMHDANISFNGSQMIAEGDALYFANHQGALGRLDIPTGQVQWLATYRRTSWSRPDIYQSVLPRQRINEVPLINDSSVVFIPADSERVFAFNKQQGTLLWDSFLPGGTESLHLSEQWLTLGGRQLFWIAADSGELAGRHPKAWQNTAIGTARSPRTAWQRGQALADNVVVQAGQGQQFKIKWDGIREQVSQQALQGIKDHGHIQLENGMMILSKPDRIVGYPYQ